MLRMTLACGDYDRTRPLVDGTVRPLGIELTCLPMTIEEIFVRMARFREFDAAEMSLSSYLISLSAPGVAPFVAILVFLSRSFRHSGTYVRTRSGIERPAQLRGKAVGVAEYQLTANVWIRGILADHYGVPVGSVHYRRDRWVARSLFDAFTTARAIALAGLDETASLRYMPPWLADDVAAVRRELGEDYWTCGLDGNEAAPSTIVRYASEEGLIPRPYEPTELFVPEVLEETVI